MNLLDVRTIIIGHFFTNLLCAVVLAVVWAQNSKRFAGTGWWLSDFVFQTVAVALVILRGVLPDWVSMTVSNTLAVAGALLGYIGLTLFVGKKSPQLHNYLLLAVFAYIHTYFVYVKPDLTARNLNLSFGLLVICFQCAWLILRRVEADMRRITRGVGLVFVIFCLANLARIVVILASPSPNNDFFQSGLFDTTILMVYQLLLILLAFNLITMVNQRLLGDIQYQEKIYSTAFRSSPYAITLTRLSDGKILDVNDGFTKISGYSHEEAIGKSILELHIWASEDDRAEVADQLSHGGRILGREFKFRKKSGETITGRFSAEVTTIHDQPWILSSVEDVTAQKRAEDALRESEALLRAIADHYPNSYVSIIEKDLTIGFTSGREFKKLNLDPNQFVGMTLAQVFGEDAPLVKENYLKSFNGAETQFELFINNQYQHYRTVPLIDQDGGISRILAVVENITARKDAEEALRAQQQNLQALIENSDGSIWSVDSKYRLIIGNALYLKNARTAIGRDLRDRENLLALNLPQEALDEWRGYYDRALLGEKFSIQVQTRFRSVPTEMEYHFNPIRAEGGKITGVTVFGRDITERKRAEEEVASLALFPMENPNPVLRVDRDGNLNYTNEAGVAFLPEWNLVTGQPAHQVLSRMAAEALLEQKTKMVEVTQKGRVISLFIVPIVDLGYVNLYGRDVTERKRNEAILQIRLKLLEFAATHGLDELMQYALDEVGELTQSPIGFYHFVEPDEKTLSLQAWSTRTLHEFCEAEGKDMHYPIDQAGVWVDCIAQRKPVIHNDYESLPHRKGLPPGHAQVVRELVSPIFRDDRIVAILGVGNKPNDYDETDAASVSHIADVVFEVVKRKQAEEALNKATEQLSLRLAEIEQLHEELREQAIHDPLTGAYNRRYMQDVIAHEFARAAREDYPVSVIMLDMDELKMLNDTYGHHIGDQALQILVSQAQGMIRAEDIICRYGGDEFTIVLGRTPAERAYKRIGELHEILQNHPMIVQDQKIPVQFTAGIASFPAHGKTMEEVVKYADMALYRAKAQGRNCTIVFA